MTKKIGVTIAAVAALGVLFTGAYTFACDGKSKTAQQASNNKSGSCSAQTAGAACCPEAKSAQTAGAACCPEGKSVQTANLNSSSCSSSKGASIQTADAKAGCSASCASKASMAANSCDGAKSASSSGCASKAQMTSESSCGSKASMTSGSSCGSKASRASNWAANACGSKGYYGANVYSVKDGKQWAVCNGKTFEVTESTPFTQVETARYYFADEGSKVNCQVKMKEMAATLESETVSLATAEGNVVSNENGQKMAKCVESGETFVVTADAPVRVMDGVKYYLKPGPETASITR